MSFQPHFPDLFAQQAATPVDEMLPATDKQIAYAQRLAARTGAALPASLHRDRRALSAWIDAQSKPRPAGRFDAYPSSKQVALAERIARLKRREVPRACFQDKTLMSRWIDSNLPR